MKFPITEQKKKGIETSKAFVYTKYYWVRRTNKPHIGIEVLEVYVNNSEII